MSAFLEGRLQALLNTSGRDYRALNFKAIWPQLSETALLERLTENGNLIKRPFLIDQDFGLVGFKQGEWQHTFMRHGRL